MPPTLGNKLRELREARDLSQSQIAEAVLGSKQRQSEVSRWEANIITPSTGNFLSLARVFSIPVEELLRAAYSSDQPQATA